MFQNFLGFATYASALGSDSVFPEFHLKDRMLIDDVHLTMKLDCYDTAVALNKETTNPDFDESSYYVAYK